MGKRGPKPKGKVRIKWSGDFAYAIGLIATDGNVSRKGSIVSLVSKDIEQVDNFKKCLHIQNKTGVHRSGSTLRTGYRVQFRDVIFCAFLNSIGILAAKSKTISYVRIPRKYFIDFVRGCFDGDGTVHSYWDKRWKSSFMFYVCFASASRAHLEWLHDELHAALGIAGHITGGEKSSVFQLKYAKGASVRLVQKMYMSADAVCLSRKRLKIKGILAIVGKSL